MKQDTRRARHASSWRPISSARSWSSSREIPSPSVAGRRIAVDRLFWRSTANWDSTRSGSRPLARTPAISAAVSESWRVGGTDAEGISGRPHPRGEPGSQGRTRARRRKRKGRGFRSSRSIVPQVRRMDIGSQDVWSIPLCFETARQLCVRHCSVAARTCPVSLTSLRRSSRNGAESFRRSKVSSAIRIRRVKRPRAPGKRGKISAQFRRAAVSVVSG